MAPFRQTLFAAAFAVVGFIAAFGLQGCGLGRESGGEGRGVTDPIVAATVNGRPIYVEDVRSYAVQRGLLQEGQDLDANSDAFYFALEELIQIRLFSMEAEARGIDRQPATRRQLENARERVLANAIYEGIDERATNPQEIERLYRENASRLGQGQEIHLRHMQFRTREEADAAKRRLDGGERFEALAFELSTDRDTAPDGGDLGFRSVSDLAPAIRDATNNSNVGTLLGPLQVENTWQLIRVEDRRERGVPSLEQLRPRIIEWLRFQEISQLQDRLERDARIERLREPDRSQAHEPSGDVTAPADATPESPRPQTAPDATAPPGAAPPPFPFPMGPGGVTGGAQPQTPVQQPAQQPAQPPAQRPAARPAQQTTTTTTAAPVQGATQ
jgi:peptidyl-prolyl cis-trans isomerase C